MTKMNPDLPSCSKSHRKICTVRYLYAKSSKHLTPSLDQSHKKIPNQVSQIASVWHAKLVKLSLGGIALVGFTKMLQVITSCFFEGLMA
jgi:hypothetical protein